MVTVHGRVIERFTRQPVAGALVSIAGRSVSTSDAGTFSLDGPLGQYELTISHANYRPKSTSINVKPFVVNLGDIAIDSIVRAF